MSRLVDRIEGDGRRQGVTNDHMTRETSPGLGGSDGFGFAQAQAGTWEPDNVQNGLDGQPPKAQTRGWGDLSWLRWRRRR